MKLATFTSDRHASPRIGQVDREAQTILDLQSAWRQRSGSDNPAFASMLALIEGGDAALADARSVVASAKPVDYVPLSSVKLLAPLPVPPQVRDCNNFEEHMRNARLGMARMKARIAGQPEPTGEGMDLTPHPINFENIVFYISNRFSVVGPDTQIDWPSYCDYFDYEGEFAAVLGKGGRNIPASQAHSHIFGFTVFNDFSARDKQVNEMEGRLGPTKGKSFDTGNAMGPWIVTADELPNYRDMNIEVRINGQRRSANTTKGMIHGFDKIISYLSLHETLHAGEVIGSGTVGGCCGLESARFLEDGDVVEIDFDKIGVLRNQVKRVKPPAA